MRKAPSQFKLLLFLPAICIATLGCNLHWSVKSVRGNDPLNLGKLVKPEGLVGNIVIKDQEERPEQIVFAVNTGISENNVPNSESSWAVLVNSQLQKNLVYRKTTLAEITSVMGEPQETKYEPNGVILVYSYTEEFDIGHYKWYTLFLRKVRTRWQFSYYFTILLKPPQLIRQPMTTSPTEQLVASLEPTNVLAKSMIDNVDETINLDPRIERPQMLFNDKTALPNMPIEQQYNYEDFVVANWTCGVVWPQKDQDDQYDPARVAGKFGSGIGGAAKKVATGGI